MATKTVIEQLIIEIAGDSKKFKATVKDIKKQNKDLEGSYKKLGTVAKASFVAIGSAAVLLGTVATKAFAEFETGVTNVAKTTNLAGKDLEDFKNEIIKMSERIPVTTDKLLEIATAAGQLGIKGTANLSKFTEVIAKLGATTNVSGEEAAIGLARILNLTNENIDSAENFASALVELGNNLETNEAEILTMATELAKSTVQFKLSSQEVLGLAGSMASLGIQAEAGSTVVQRAFSEIDRIIRDQTGPEFEKLTELTGLAGNELTKAFGDDAVGVFRKFLGGLQEAGKGGKFLKDELNELGLSGIRIEKILPTMAENFDQVTKSLDLSSDAFGENIALQDEATTAFETNAAKWQIAQNKINNTFIELGADIAPQVTEALTDISDAVSDNKDAIGVFGKAIALTIGAFLAQIKSIASNMRDLGSLYDSTIGRVVAGISDYVNKHRDAQKTISNSIKQADKWVDAEKKKEKSNKKFTDSWLKSNKKVTKAQKEGSKERLAEIEAEAMRKAEIQADADEEAFSEIEEMSDKVVEEARDKNGRILTEEEKASEERLRVRREESEMLEAQTATDFEIERFAAIKAANEKIETEKKKFGELDDLHAKHNSGILLSETEFGKKMIAIKEFTATAEFQATKDAAGSLSALINSENDELKAIGKAASIVQIGISTAEGALKAFSSLAWIPFVGPALGGVAAAALVAYGGEQISEVAGMKTGGVVPGSGSGDIVPAMLEPGELVVPKDVTAEMMKRLGARHMAEGGAVGKDQKEGLNKTFDSIFGVPGIFLSLMGLGGDSNTTANGFGSSAFAGMADAMMPMLGESADAMLELMLSASPVGPIIAKMLKEAGLKPSDLVDLLGSGPTAEILKGLGLDDDVARVVTDLFGGATDIIGGAVGGAEDLLKGAGDLLGFKNGGIVPGSGSGDSVAAMLEPGELVIPKSFASSFGGSISGSGGGPGGGGAQTVHNTFEFALKDDLIDFVSVGLRQKEIQGT